MDLQDLSNLLNTFNFRDVVKNETETYLLGSGYSFNSYLESSVDNQKFILNGLKKFPNKEDKVTYLLVTIDYLKSQLQSAVDELAKPEISEEKETYHWLSQTKRDWSKQKHRAETQLFYAARELEKLGIKEIDKRAFDQAEVNELTRKINALLIKIDEVTVGQEIIFDFIAELKSDLGELKTDFPLGKKRWYQRFTGIVGSYVANKGADALFDSLKPEIARVILDQGHKLLNI